MTCTAPRLPKQADTGRIRFLDAAKGLGILIIVWGHLDYLWSPASEWFSSFKLAIFYIISGLLCGQRQQESWSAVAKKRIFSLMIPYFVYSLLAVLFHLQYSADNWLQAKPIIKTDFLYTVTLRGASTLWFLPSLYFGEILFAATNLRSRRKETTAVVLAALPVLLWGLSVAFTELQPVFARSTVLMCASYLYLTVFRSVVAFWFIAVGFLLRNYFFGRKPVHICLIVCGLAANIALSLLNKDVDLNFLGFGKYPLVFFVNGVLGSVVVLDLLRLLERRCKLPVTGFCGKHALFIMASHLPWYLSMRIQRHSLRFFSFENTTLGYYAVCLACLAALMLVEVLLIAAKQGIKKLLLRRADPQGFWSKTLKYL